MKQIKLYCKVFPSLVKFFFFFLVMTCYSSVNAQFVKGADIGWLLQMEATGYIFYNSNGVEENCLQILKDKGINSVRLRVFVNPSNDKTSGHCSKNETVTIALRAKEMGMRIMIDFHYSDSWADPGKQNKPAAWVNHTFNQLLNDVYNHTYEVLDTLKKSGVTPDWVQIGNEIANGMLWPDGRSTNFPQLAQLLKKGYAAAKSVDTSIKVIIHLESGSDNSKCRWFFDNVVNYGVNYDIIGLSYYPYWIGSDYTVTIDDLGNNMNDLTARYGKEVMVVEVGGDYKKVQNTYDMLVAVINKTLSVPGNNGLGVIYWEPQGAKSWSGYQLSCWGDDHRPTAAIDAFLINPSGIHSNNAPIDFSIYPNPCSNGVIKIEADTAFENENIRIFDTNGRLLLNQTLNKSISNTIYVNLKPGLYLVSIGNAQNTSSKKIIIR